MTNRYPGINPHLNSLLQSTGGNWHSFHNSCIERMADVLQDVLPPGYYPFTEKALQLQRVGADADAVGQPKQWTYPDILVERATGQQQVMSSPLTAGVQTPTLVLPVAEYLAEAEILMSVVIHRMNEQQPDQPVTRIELLSPANKPGGGHHDQYLINRSLTLEAGLNLVEVDWLHETRPLLSGIPAYPRREPDAYPYHILVSSPHPTLQAGKTEVYGFRVQDALPVIRIPLAEPDAVALDFGRVYRQTIAGRVAFQRLIDDTQPPVRIETYDPQDREFIEKQMEQIASLARQRD